MKYLKMLGMVTALAMILMVFGPSTASATTLEEGTASVHPTVLDLSLVGSAIYETTGGTTIMTCTGGTIESKPSTGDPTETVTASVAAADLTWSGCSSTTDTTQGGELEIHHIAGTSNGTLTGRTFEVTVNTFGTSCTFGFSNSDTMRDLGTLIGDAHTPKSEINVMTFERTEDKFLCPNEARWTATYHVTSPTGLTVTAG